LSGAFFFAFFARLTERGDKNMIDKHKKPGFRPASQFVRPIA
jgi:hypothetical protein